MVWSASHSLLPAFQLPPSARARMTLHRSQVANMSVEFYQNTPHPCIPALQIVAQLATKQTQQIQDGLSTKIESISSYVKLPQL
jgi:hypothetical protein